MHEVSSPDTVTVSDKENLTDAVWANAEQHPDAVSFRRRVDGQWVEVTSAEFAEQVTAVAQGLVAGNVAPGDRVALLSTTRYEWTLLDYAIWAAGAVTVPIYETSAPEQVQWILSDSGAVAAIVETSDHRALVDGLDGLDALRHVWQIDAPGGSADPAGVVDELATHGADIEPATVAQRAAAVGADDLATLIYTSGTTGRPKGCELTHRNLLAEIRADSEAFRELLQPGNSVLLFLPLAHVFARVIQCCSVYNRITLGHTPNVAHLQSDLAEFAPAFVLSVPRVFEKVYNNAKQKAHAEGKGRIFDMAEATALAWSQARDRGGPGLGLRVRHAVFDRLVYAKLRGALGGRCIGAVSGGAPLGRHLGHFFRGIGLPVREGYGLTETTAAATANTLDATKLGTVGRPVPGTAVRIADDGEILVSGDVVFRRYWNNQDATAATFADGWFATGDLGELDEDGFLRVTGRKKEMIVTAGGKNVAPAALEDRLRAHRLVSQCMVVGDQRRFVAALVTLDAETVPTWLREQGKPADTPVADLTTDPGVRAEVQAAVDEANSAVSAAEQIKKFRILPVDFTEHGGELTPTLKLKRPVVAQRYADEIDALYAG